MSSDHLPANTNEPPFAAMSWAPWPASRPYIAAWTAVACAGFSNWLMLQEAMFEAGRAVMRFPHHVDEAADTPAAAALSAAAEDLRDCGEAVMQAQVDALEALRHSA